MKIMIFDTMISGHHLEYIHHIYNAAGLNKKNEYYFVIPETFEDVKSKLIWKYYENIKFKYIQSIDLKNENMNHLSKSIHLCSLLNKYIKEISPNHTFLISLIDYAPFLPLIISSKYRISGIIYKIYLYEWKQYSTIQKIYEAIRQFTLIQSKLINHIFILNDNSATKYLNKKWHTNKFKFLPDPYVPLTNINNTNIRSIYNIPLDKKIILHMGSMDARKGTLEILDAVDYLKDPHKYCFIFAGKVANSISQPFYQKIRKIKEKSNIIILDKFCEYNLLASLSSGCDCILLPYKRVSLSSGILYYAAQFNKTVITTGKGLLGKLVKKHKLGITIEDSTPDKIAKAIDSLKYKTTDSSSFLENRTIHDFTTIIINNIICNN